MKRKNIFLALACVLLMLTVTACANTAGTTDDNSAAPTPNEKHQIAYPDGYDTTTTGASSYANSGDHFDSIYFAHPDVYNMKSTDTLTIIPKFETYQQTTEYTCGACSTLMVLNHYGVKDYDEMTIAKMAGTSETEGIDPAGLVKFYKAIGWNVKSSEDTKETLSFEDPADFTAWVQENLTAGTPIQVDWIDWAGHWQDIIGYDTMGTKDQFGDDVLILADPYDTSDQYQDGYYIFPAERFFYMWREGSYVKGDKEQPWVIATPAA